MIITRNPTGLNWQKGIITDRYDLTPEPGEKSYASQHVYVPVYPDGTTEEQMNNPVWVSKLPHIWRTNPCLCTFIRINENITLKDMTDFIGDTFNQKTILTIDDIMSRTGEHESAHLISPYMRGKGILSTARTITFDQQTKDFINSRLAALAVTIKPSGIVEYVEPKSIDVGPGATDRATATGDTGYTYVAHENTANADGTLDTFQTYFVTNGVGVQVGVFYVVSDNNLTTRSNANWGNVASGSQQTLDLSVAPISVSSGDYIGLYKQSGTLEKTSTGAEGFWYQTGDYIPCTNQLFTRDVGTTISLYATGTETPTTSKTKLWNLGMSVATNMGQFRQKTLQLGR
jgi:hypothetical protein